MALVLGVALGGCAKERAPLSLAAGPGELVSKRSNAGSAVEAGAPVGAGAQLPLASAAETRDPGSRDYKVGPQDVLDITVFKVPELNKRVQVADTGTVSFPLTGEIQASGLSPRDIEQDLARRLGEKYLRDPQVTVLVREYNSQRISVEGAVRRPGVFPYRGRTTLLQAIAMAAGLDAASDATIVVFRTREGQRHAAHFNVGDIRAGTSPDPPVEPGDVVVVPTSALKEAMNAALKALPLAGIFAPLL